MLTGNSPTNYVEKSSVGFSITCAVCHDPHANTNEGQLRRPIDNPDQATNLCSTCHVRSATATPAFTINSRGAHAAQGAVYFGEAAGWQPPGFTFDPSNPIYTAHLSRNNRLCAGCHVPNFTTTDAATGEEFTSVGHLFSPNPCKDANGLPTTGDCAFTATARFWTGCVGSGCHNTEAEAAGLFNSERQTVTLLENTLWTDTDGDKVLDQTDGGVLAAVLRQRPTTVTPATDSTHFCCTGATKDNSLSVAEGALFNARMLGANLYDHNDGSYGIHNPALYEGLLASSITAVRTRYNIPASVVSPAAEAAIQSALNKPGIRYVAPASVRQTAAR
jgi:predicted CXXCH cytochrome family protein